MSRATFRLANSFVRQRVLTAVKAAPGASRDEHGNVSVVLPVLTARGRSTVHAWADPSCLRPTGGEG